MGESCERLLGRSCPGVGAMRMGALFWPSGMLWFIDGVLALLSWDAEWALDGRDGVGDVT